MSTAIANHHSSAIIPLHLWSCTLFSPQVLHIDINNVTCAQRSQPGFAQACHVPQSLNTTLFNVPLQAVPVELQASWRSPENRPHDGGVRLQVLPVQPWRLPVHRYTHTHTLSVRPMSQTKTDSQGQTPPRSMPPPSSITRRYRINLERDAIAPFQCHSHQNLDPVSGICRHIPRVTETSLAR